VRLARVVPQHPLQLLIVVVMVDVAIAAVLRWDHTTDVLAGAHSWRSWLGAFGSLYLLVVVYAIRRVAHEAEALHGSIDRSEGALAAYTQTTRDWLWETTPDLAVTYSSDRVEDLLGYSPDDLLGRDAHDFMTPSTARRSRAALSSGLARQGWRDVRSEWVHADGRAVILDHSGTPLWDQSGVLLGYRGSGVLVSSDEEQARCIATLRERVRRALDHPDLEMALQPIISIETGRLTGVEALARFGDGRPPDLWFDEAGKAGLRQELEALAIRRAVERIDELPDGVSMSVNACPDVIIDPDFLPMLLELKVPLDRVIIEVTEHVRIDEYSRLQTAVAALRDVGLRLAVDDTGAGYASLSHVLRLRPDIIKLDRSIISSIDTDGARRTLVTALVLLALDMDAVVTAEGVETEAELGALATLGVDHAQGYLIARPSVDLSQWPAALRT
jgi:PAS domain S-box-containing protein